VLAPHYAEDAELGVRRFASSKQKFDLLVFIRSQPMITQNFWGDRKGRQGGHEGKFYFRISWRLWVGRNGPLALALE
jgi:hypothetical protein